MKKRAMFILFCTVLNFPAFAQQFAVDADTMMVGAQLIPTPALSYYSISTDTTVTERTTHFLDRTFWEGTSADHLNEVGPDTTYCNLHLEDSKAFLLKGSRIKHVKHMTYKDIVYYTEDGAYSTLVVTKVDGVRNNSQKLTSVRYSLRMDHVDEKGVQTIGTTRGYLKCQRGLGLWMTSSSLKIENVLHQLGGRFELH